LRRFDLDQHTAAKGLPPAGLRGLPQDRSPPHICDASRARPSSGRDAHGDSPDDTPCQEQSENIASRPVLDLPAPPPSSSPSPDLIRAWTVPPRHHRARPGVPDRLKRRASPHRDGRHKAGHDRERVSRRRSSGLSGPSFETRPHGCSSGRWGWKRDGRADPRITSGDGHDVGEEAREPAGVSPDRVAAEETEPISRAESGRGTRPHLRTTENDTVPCSPPATKRPRLCRGLRTHAGRAAARITPGRAAS
jgi:hypothetical protein